MQSAPALIPVPLLQEAIGVSKYVRFYGTLRLLSYLLSKGRPRYRHQTRSDNKHLSNPRSSIGGMALLERSPIAYEGGNISRLHSRHRWDGNDINFTGGCRTASRPSMVSTRNRVLVLCIEVTSATFLLEILYTQLQVPGDKQVTLDFQTQSLDTTLSDPA